MRKKITAIVILAVISPCLWWLYLLIHPELATKEIDLFLLYDQETPQKSYWYVFYTSQLMLNIIMWLVVHELHNIPKLKIVTKSVVVLQILLLVEYWVLGGTLPYIPVGISFLLYIYSCLKK